jgi:putative addiction module component (TIGR02574 family)
MIKERIPAIEKLSKKEKILLAGELWDEAFTEEDVELTEDQKEELNKRIKYAEKHPDEMIPWEQVRDEIREKYGR